MTSEYLLDAIGLIDDALIQEAEALPAQPVRPAWRPWLTWAACAVLVIALGYQVVRVLPLAGGGSSGGGGAPSGAASAGGAAEPFGPAPSAGGESMAGMGSNESALPFPGEAEDEAAAPPSGGAAEGSASAWDQGAGAIWIYGPADGAGTYRLTGEAVEQLPPDCLALGTLAQAGPESPEGFRTQAEEYAGCALWSDRTGGTLYVQRPGGGYAVAELVQP